MAVDFSDVKEFMDAIGSSPEANFKMLLYYADLSGNFEDDDDWDTVCQFATQFDSKFDQSTSFLKRYKAAFDEGGVDRSLSAMSADLLDNYILAALAIHRMDIEEKWIPFVAWNAYNKHAYQGLRDEFAVLRLLQWAGFDINAVSDEDAMTALHYFASQKYLPGTNPRAVKWLLEHGADVDAPNRNGDTALTYLCATQGWSRPHSESFVSLVNAGSNPFKPSNDGATPYSLLSELNAKEPRPERSYLIGLLDQLRAEMERDELDAALGDAGQHRPARQMAL